MAHGQGYSWEVFNREVKARALELTCTEFVRIQGLAPKGSHNRKQFNIRCPSPSHEDRNPSCSIRETHYNCFSCGIHGDIFNLIELLEGVSGFDAQIRRALELLGIDYDAELEAFMAYERAMNERAPQHTSWSASSAQIPDLSGVDLSNAALARSAQHPDAPAVWADLVSRLTLTPTGSYYLERRGVSAALARAHGLVSAHYDRWSKQVEDARTRWDDETLAACGVLTTSGMAHPYVEYLLLIPSWREGMCVGLRFRRLSHDTTYGGVKYLSLRGGTNQVESPYLATRTGLPNACGPHRGILWVVEGELDTLSIRSVGRAAIGAPGALSWRPEWVEGWASLPHVVILKDHDPTNVDAADKFVERVRAAALEQHGQSWCDAHLHVYTTPNIDGAKDANDLLKQGEDVLIQALEEIESALDPE